MDRARHSGSRSGCRRGRVARTQIVEAEAAATVVPPDARKGLQEAAPDTLCATGSLVPSDFPLPPGPTSGCGCRPSPTDAGGSRPFVLPAASACCGPGKHLGIPFLHRDPSQLKLIHSCGSTMQLTQILRSLCISWTALLELSSKSTVGWVGGSADFSLDFHIWDQLAVISSRKGVAVLHWLFSSHSSSRYCSKELEKYSQMGSSPYCQGACHLMGETCK
nr:uncharacterized protein LOC100612616 isoform X2 [Pan troglodytes]XP_016778041.3 uncharacterized protein LOC100612616 isoform X2 [Pan troglodytes]